MKKRSYDPEIMDLGPAYYTQEEYHNCLYQLGRIGHLLGGDKATLKAFKKVSNITSIIDVGCGGGTFTIKLAQQFPNTYVLGIDIDPQAITYAQSQLSHLTKPLKNLYFERRDNPLLSEKEKSFDVVTATLVCHHLNDNALIDFLQRATRIARKMVIINDLHRHWIAYSCGAIIIPLFFRNRLTVYDSLLSIKKAFTYADWVSYLSKAGLDENSYAITWHWPFRWIVAVNSI